MMNCQSCEVLGIGDSNTEIGHIVNGLNAILRRQFGECGSGYISLNDKKTGIVAPPIIAVSNDDGWKQLDMFDAWTRLPPPHLAPDGNWVESARPGAVTTVTAMQKPGKPSPRKCSTRLPAVFKDTLKSTSRHHAER